MDGKRHAAEQIIGKLRTAEIDLRGPAGGDLHYDLSVPAGGLRLQIR